MASKDWKIAIGLSLALKAASLLILYAGWRLAPQADYGVDLWITRPKTSLVDNLANFDGAWFVRVAALGYQRLASGDYDLARETARFRVMDQLGYEQGRWPPEAGSNRFDRGYGFRHWPLFPLLIRCVSGLGVDPVLAGVLLSNCLTLLYGVLLYFLVRLDFSPKAAVFALLFSQFHPGGYALSAVFNESLFLALAAGAMLAARRERWWLAGLCGLSAATARIDGALLIVPLAYEWMTEQARKNEGAVNFSRVLGLQNIGRGFRGFLQWPGVWWSFLIPAGTALVILYFRSITGDALIWTKVHEVNVYGHVNWPWLMMAETFRKGAHVWMKELPLHALLLVVLIWSFRKVRGTYWVWMLVFFLYQVSNANHSYLRYQVQGLPLFVALAALAEERECLALILLALFVGGFGVFGAMFVNGYWVA